MSEKRRPRPLSPHLMIYTPSLTMMMSIAHRITGAGLYVGCALLALWLWTLALPNPLYFAYVSFFLHSWAGQVFLFAFAWAFFHHLLGGVRHAIWDLGYGLDPPWREHLALLTLLGGFALTCVTFIFAFYFI